MNRPCDKCGESDGRTVEVAVLENRVEVDSWFLCACCRAELIVQLGALPHPRRLP